MSSSKSVVIVTASANSSFIIVAVTHLLWKKIFHSIDIPTRRDYALPTLNNVTIRQSNSTRPLFLLVYEDFSNFSADKHFAAVLLNCASDEKING
jgi:hypothetical protein